jgi:organic radical activating enzyme
MKRYDYNGREPTKIKVEDLREDQARLLLEDRGFCMYPWMHLHAFPTGEAFPCCMTEMAHGVGNTRDNSLAEIWNDKPMRDIRAKMLAGETVEGCRRCHEQEAAGFFSLRYSANKNFGHLIDLVDGTMPDGRLDSMVMAYWDIRFSNLCNLRCRSCGHLFSSNWYDDQIKMIDAEGHDGAGWRSRNTRINFAGRHADDIWDQLKDHIDEVERVYFAGGEPLIMEEHYRLLKELLARGKTNVSLVYNTNFTETVYKKTDVFELWREFESVSVGASLDADGQRAEYMRKGCDWSEIERNRERMLTICPNVDFYVSPTLSVMNAYNITDFHTDWVSKGFIRPQDLNVNILQDPDHYRIDIMTPAYKQIIKERFECHLRWLKPRDPITRATVGFESAIKFMMADDKRHLIPRFWDKTNRLDQIRGEDILRAIPEIGALKH